MQLVTLVVNRENLEALAALLEPGDVKVVIDKVYPLSQVAPTRGACMRGAATTNAQAGPA